MALNGYVNANNSWMAPLAKALLSSPVNAFFATQHRGETQEEAASASELVLPVFPSALGLQSHLGRGRDGCRSGQLLASTQR